MSPAIGYAVREQNRQVMVEDPAINAAEITFERADDPLRLEDYLGGATFDYVSVHALKLSPGSADPPRRDYLDRLKQIAEENGAESISDHLGFTRDNDQGVELGHFSPVPWTTESLDVTSRNLDIICRELSPLHFYLENIAYLFQLQGDMSEAEYLYRLLDRSACGWLLDITNVYANATNFGFDAYEFIDQVLPAAHRLQIHLAGGFWDEKVEKYIDSHSHPVPQAVWDLYRHVLQRAGDRVSAVFIERDQNFPDDQGWMSEIRLARELADAVAA